MVMTKKDSEGRVIAWAEVRIVDEFAQETPVGAEPGIYAWVNDVWIHESLRSKNRFNVLLLEFIREGYKLFPWLRYVYWNRGKYSRRLSCYNIRRMLHEPLQKV